MPDTGLDLHMIQRDKLAMLGQLTAGVAHELNNPIGYIASNISTLERYVQRIMSMLEELAPDEPDERWLQVTGRHKWESMRVDLPELLLETREGTDHLKALVSDLKTLGRSSAAREGIDPNVCITSALNVLHHRLKHGFTVHRDLQQLPTLQLVRSQIIQALTNLLHNAIQAMGDGGEILIESHLRDRQVQIVVEDSGPGIPPEQREQIFDAYFTTKASGAGTGLGLAIVRQIAAEHAGSVWCESGNRLGGARFVITLPSASP
ncbi:MAG: sensor histidine kinase [Planctomycetota bacterium]